MYLRAIFVCIKLSNYENLKKISLRIKKLSQSKIMAGRKWVCGVKLFEF